MAKRLTPRRSVAKKRSAAKKKAPRNAYVLRLYVTGATPSSTRAITNLKTICEEHLKGQYRLDIVDIYQQPHLAAGDQIVAVPTLIKRVPAPLRTLVGDLSDRERVLLGLDLRRRD